jgi:hypothetical protein
MKNIIYVSLIVAVVGIEELYFSKVQYEKGFTAAEQQYKKMLAKEGYACYNPKTGEWNLLPQISRDTNDLDTLVYSLETELSLVKSQIEAQHVDKKKNKK